MSLSGKQLLRSHSCAARRQHAEFLAYPVTGWTALETTSLQFPKDKAAILVMERMKDSNGEKSWRSHVIKWADGFPGKGRFDGEKWDNFFFDDVDKDGVLDIVANCEEYKKLGVEWFENPLRNP